MKHKTKQDYRIILLILLVMELALMLFTLYKWQISNQVEGLGGLGPFYVAISFSACCIALAIVIINFVVKYTKASN
jgi:hypothetical protein